MTFKPLLHLLHQEGLSFYKEKAQCNGQSIFSSRFLSHNNTNNGMRTFLPNHTRCAIFKQIAGRNHFLKVLMLAGLPQITF